MYTISLYILTFCMGIVVMIGHYRGIDLNFLATIQMFYPALIVIILEKTSLPILQHLYIIETIFGITFGIISLFRMDVIWVFSIISLIIHVIFLVIILKAMIKQKNRKCNFKKNFFLFMMYILFWLIYLGAYAYLEGNFQLFLQKITNLHLWKNFIFYLPIFLVNFLPFIGEEYGWRFFFATQITRQIWQIFWNSNGRNNMGIVAYSVKYILFWFARLLARIHSVPNIKLCDIGLHFRYYL